MKSIKFGRGPSFLRGIRSLCAVAVGLTWTICLLRADNVPFFFILIGIITIVIGATQAIYDFKNATSKERFSSFDITDENEETDALNRYFGKKKEPDSREGPKQNTQYCPYCGARVHSDYGFCRQCGKKR